MANTVNIFLLKKPLRKKRARERLKVSKALAYPPYLDDRDVDSANFDLSKIDQETYNRVAIYIVEKLKPYRAKYVTEDKVNWEKLFDTADGLVEEGCNLFENQYTLRDRVELTIYDDLHGILERGLSLPEE